MCCIHNTKIYVKETVEAWTKKACMLFVKIYASLIQFQTVWYPHGRKENKLKHCLRILGKEMLFH